MKSKRLSLDDFKKKAAASNEKLAYAKGGLGSINIFCGRKPVEDTCHPSSNE
ncbi:MAG: hypothetical protein WBA74_03415 [Cyclobacteriaceae bacterium]